jgi:hypothetical protein
VDLTPPPPDPSAQVPAAPPWVDPPALPPIWTAPPPGPGWTAQPVAPSGWLMPDPLAQSGPVTRIARLGGLVVALIGALWMCLGGLLILAALFVPGLQVQLEEEGYSGIDVRATFLGAGALVIAIAAVEFAGGIGVLFQKDWGRVIGIVYGLLFGTGSALLVVEYLGARPTTVLAILFAVHLVAYIFITAVFLARWRGRPPA